jgi:hypothetical protein
LERRRLLGSLEHDDVTRRRRLSNVRGEAALSREGSDEHDAFWLFFDRSNEIEGCPNNSRPHSKHRWHCTVCVDSDQRAHSGVLRHA